MDFSIFVNKIKFNILKVRVTKLSLYLNNKNELIDK